MPIYEFVCQDCGHEFEKIQSFSDSSVPTCPNCQGRHVQRRLSAPAIHFKGSGWYITDSKNSAKTSATGGANSEKGEGGKSEGAKASENRASENRAGESKAGEGNSGDSKTEPAKSQASKSETAKQDSGSTSTKTSAD